MKDKGDQNDKDCYVLAVEKKDTGLGHLPRKISCVCSLSLRQGGSIECRVTGKRRYSSDLPKEDWNFLEHL